MNRPTFEKLQLLARRDKAANPIGPVRGSEGGEHSSGRAILGYRAGDRREAEEREMGQIGGGKAGRRSAEGVPWDEGLLLIKPVAYAGVL